MNDQIVKAVTLRDQLLTPFEKTFNQFFNEFFRDGKDQLNRIKSNAYFPKLDILEDGNELVVKIAVAGMTKDDISIEIEKSNLTISGKQVVEKENIKYHIKELSSKSFSRTIQLPEWATEENVTAVIKDGLLKLTWPMPKVNEEKEKTKRIEIKVE